MISGSSPQYSVESTLRINEFLKSGGEIIHVENKEGKYSYYYDGANKCIWLNYLASQRQGHGFGISAMSSLMKKSFELGCPGKIMTDAVWSSHLFYLYLGMIPEDKKIDYIYVTHGNSAAYAMRFLFDLDCKEGLNNFSDCKIQAIEEHHKYIAYRLTNLLREEKNIAQDALLTFKDVIANREFLFQLRDKPASYIRDIFIPDLLHVLNEHYQQSTDIKYPDTSILDSVIMRFSDEGIKRWQNAIQSNSKFSLFENFENLLPFMDESQKNQFDLIIQKRNSKKLFSNHFSAASLQNTSTLYGLASKPAVQIKQENSYCLKRR